MIPAWLTTLLTWLATSAIGKLLLDFLWGKLVAWGKTVIKDKQDDKKQDEIIDEASKKHEEAAGSGSREERENAIKDGFDNIH